MNKETTYRLNYLELAISVFWESEIPYEVSSVILLLLSGLQTKKINSLVFFLFLFFLSFLFFSQNPNGTWQDGGLQYIPGGARGKIQRGGGHDEVRSIKARRTTTHHCNSYQETKKCMDSA